MSILPKLTLRKHNNNIKKIKGKNVSQYKLLILSISLSFSGNEITEIYTIKI